MECLLLDLYTQQIAAPVQRAYEQGRTRVNPASLMAADGAEVQQFWERAHDYARAYGLDGRPIPDSIERLSQKTRQRADTRERIIAAVLWSAVGVTVLVMALGGIWLLTATPEVVPSAVSPIEEQATAAEARATPSPVKFWLGAGFFGTVMRCVRRSTAIILRWPNSFYAAG